VAALVAMAVVAAEGVAVLVVEATTVTQVAAEHRIWRR
jgi:hypothetical protein